jgi:hypothetical protein
MKGTLLITALLLATGLYSCKKDDTTNNPNNPNNTNTAKVSMHLTDGPADYDAVYIDIQSVEFTVSGSNAVTLLPIRAGVYDLLHFRNGLDTLLMTATVPAGTVSQIRLLLGPNNSVVVDGVPHDLGTPSAQESGLKLNLKETLVAGGSYDMWIDFDAGKSILQTGNGKYKLKPVIRAYSAATNGRIKGYALPFASFTTVYAINGVDTFAAIPSTIDGFYMLSGLPAANYTVWFDAGAVPYIDTTYYNVPVTFGLETNLGTTILH